MNNSIYEEYMRNVLGYQPIDNPYNYDMYYDNSEMANMYNMSAISSIQRQELESCYPEIYRIVYPMVQKVCIQNANPLTRELIDNMTDEIYFSIEDKEMTENRNKDEKTVKSTETIENRQTTFRNSTLRDIVRILLLRELLGRPGFPGGRPPFPNPPRPRPSRPPMRPPMGPPRPQPRPGMGGFDRYAFDLYNELYEC